MTKKLLKLSVLAKSCLMVVLLSALTVGSQAQVIVTVDTGMNWVGYMNWFHPTGGWAAGSVWGVADLKTEVDPGNGSMKLKPNYNTWNPNDTTWTLNGMGNKMMEANTYIEDTTLIGKKVTFEGFVDSFTLDTAYAVEAFIKVLDPNNGWATVLHTKSPINSTGIFLVTDSIPNTPGLIPQYGFTVMGLNADPANEAALGHVYIRGNNAPPTPMIDVTLQVQNAPGADVYVQGSWDWTVWPGMMMTATTNNIHEITLNLPADSTIEYVYVTVDGTDTTKETLDPTESCTNGDNTYTNRMTVLPDTNVSLCAQWELCAGCTPDAVFAPSAQGDMSLLANLEGLTVNSATIQNLKSLKIYDITGRMIYGTTDIHTDQKVNVRLQSGVFYLVTVESDQGLQTFKVVL